MPKSTVVRISTLVWSLRHACVCRQHRDLRPRCRSRWLPKISQTRDGRSRHLCGSRRNRPRRSGRTLRMAHRFLRGCDHTSQSISDVICGRKSYRSSDASASFADEVPPHARALLAALTAARPGLEVDVTVGIGFTEQNLAEAMAVADYQVYVRGSLEATTLFDWDSPLCDSDAEEYRP